MAGGLLGGVTGNGLSGHAAVLNVLELVHDRGQFTRMHLHRSFFWLEIPRPAHIGIELHRDGAAGIHLAVAQDLRRLRGFGIAGHLRFRDRQHVDPGDFANGLVNRHQCVPEAKHARSDHCQLANHLQVCTTQVHQMSFRC